MFDMQAAAQSMRHGEAGVWSMSQIEEGEYMQWFRHKREADHTQGMLLAWFVV
jgi:hypothetical protein